MKKAAVTILSTCLFLLFCSTQSIANEFDFRLSANQDALDTEFSAIVGISNSRLMTGIGGVYDNDDYKILLLKALITDDIFIDGLTGGLGFRGAWGEAEKRRIEGDILNLGFMCYVAYDLTQTDLNQYPVVFSASFSLSPEPLSFADTEEFIDFSAECSWKVLDQAALVLNYRYLEIDFKERTKWQKADSAGYVGLRFFF